MAIYAGKSILKNFAGDLEVRLRETTPSYSVFLRSFGWCFFIDRARRKNFDPFDMLIKKTFLLFRTYSVNNIHLHLS